MNKDVGLISSSSSLMCCSYCWPLTIHFVVQGRPIVVILSCESMAYDCEVMDPMNVAIASTIDSSTCPKQQKREEKRKTVKNKASAKWVARKMTLMSRMKHFLPETRHFTTIVWTMMKTAHRTQCILQIWINLHFFREFCRFDFNECRGHSFHVRTIAIECYTARANRILMLVGINT